MAKSTEKTQENDEPLTGLALLRKPFELHQISKLPKPTKRQTDEVKADFKKGIRCQACGGWHHKDVVHLDYVGHAALTDRLLDVDPEWNWEPVTVDEHGAPVLDRFGGMWIRLTVCGVTRLGYGHADNKTGGDAVKEVIGDCLRNAAMRFGAALDLWHKGALHLDDGEPSPSTDGPADDLQANAVYTQAEFEINKAASKDDLRRVWETTNWAALSDDEKVALDALKNARIAVLKKAAAEKSGQKVAPNFDNLEPDPFPGGLPGETIEAAKNLTAG